MHLRSGLADDAKLIGDSLKVRLRLSVSDVEVRELV